MLERVSLNNALNRLFKSYRGSNPWKHQQQHMTTLKLAIVFKITFIALEPTHLCPVTVVDSLGWNEGEPVLLVSVALFEILAIVADLSGVVCARLDCVIVPWNVVLNLPLVLKVVSLTPMLRS